MGKKRSVQPNEDQPASIAPLGVTMTAIFCKATTTVDGGWNLTFTVSQDEAAQVMQISEFREHLLQLAVLPINEYS